MATNNTPQDTSRSYRYLHRTPEELAHLSPDELLQACLEYRSLLQVVAGILATPQTSLTLRIVAADLLYTQAQRISAGQLPDEASPVVYDIKTVSERLGMRPAEVRRAYEQLSELGGVHILARQYPKPRERWEPPKPM
jgi:hypothetical protein